MRWCSLLCLGLLAMAGFTGCNKSGGPAPTTVEIPKTPDGTVMAVTHAIGNGKFEAIWQAMPESYQGDVNHLIEHLAEHMDPEVYNKVMGVVGKFVKVLSEKQDLILNNAAVKAQIESSKSTPAEAKDAMTAFAGLLGDIQKDIKTKDDLEKLNVEKYLANIGSRVKSIEPIVSKNSKVNLGTEMNKLTKLKATAKNVSTDAATVEITDADGKTETAQLVRVEGKWVPKEVADSWKDKIKEMDDKLHDSAELSPEQKKQVITVADAVDGILDELLKAKDQAAFDATINGAMGKLMPVFMGGGMPPPM